MEVIYKSCCGIDVHKNKLVACLKIKGKKNVIKEFSGQTEDIKSMANWLLENNCEKVFCLGDLAMAGPEPTKVINFVKSQSNWIVIQGNTDKMIADFSPEILKNTERVFPVMAHALE